MLLERFRENTDDVNSLALQAITELWRSKVIAHADEEETTLYRDIEKIDIKFNPVIERLSRDHEVLRRLCDMLESEMPEKDYTHALQIAHALILLNDIHSDDEMALIREVEGRL
ncbi:MAG: hypothetical protein QXN26_03250 [Thermoplasmataceae archaeon]